MIFFFNYPITVIASLIPHNMFPRENSFPYDIQSEPTLPWIEKNCKFHSTIQLKANGSKSSSKSLSHWCHEMYFPTNCFPLYDFRDLQSELLFTNIFLKHKQHPFIPLLNSKLIHSSSKTIASLMPYNAFPNIPNKISFLNKFLIRLHNSTHKKENLEIWQWRKPAASFPILQ